MNEVKSTQGGKAATATNEYSGKLISAASIASPFQADISEAIKRRRDTGLAIPKLIGILATPSPPSVAYAEWTKKACEQVGIEFEIWKTWCEDAKADQDGIAADTTMATGSADEKRQDTDLEADVEDLIIAANADDAIHGIMVYYPIFGGRQDTYLQQIVDPRKDVEGLHFSYCWNMYHNVRWILPRQLGGAPGTTTEAGGGPTDGEDRVPAGFAKSILPCTPLAVVKCLEAMNVYDATLPYGDRLYGKSITVINRSEVVGRPLAALLSNDGAKVFSIDLDSVQEFNKRATMEKDRRPSEAVTRARERNSQRRLRTHHTVRPCVMTMQQCIEASDVVISGVPSPNFRIDTDWIKEDAVTVNFSSEKNFGKDVRKRASKHLPAIGKTTIAMLQRNLLRLVQYREMGATAKAGPGDDNDDDDDDNDDFQMDDKSKSNFSPPSAGGAEPRNLGGGGTGEGRGGRQEAAGGNNAPAGQSSGTTGAKDDDTLKDSMIAEEGTQRSRTWSPSKTNHIATATGFASRGRASTVTLPHSVSDRMHDRPGSNLIPHASDWIQAKHRASTTSNSTTTSTMWDWRQSEESRRESVATTATSIEGLSPHTGKTSIKAIAPPAAPSSSTVSSSSHPSASSHMFSPVSPFSVSRSVATSSRGGSVYTPPSLADGANSISSPRSTTPLSPPMFDSLTVDEGPYFSTGIGRSSWGPSTARNGKDELAFPLLERPTKDLPQRFARPPFAALDDKKMVFAPSNNVSVNMISIPAPFPSSEDEVQESRTIGAPEEMTVSPRRDSDMLDQTASERIVHSRRRRRPPFSYSTLIAQAISSSPDNRMTLREIYTWISQAYPDLYSMDGNEGSGWQNTVRHNLSLNKCFVKVPRTAQDIYDSCSSGLPNQSQAAKGKGGWWMLDYNLAQAQLGSNFRRGSAGGSTSSAFDGYSSEHLQPATDGSVAAELHDMNQRRGPIGVSNATPLEGLEYSLGAHLSSALRQGPNGGVKQEGGVVPSVLAHPNQSLAIDRQAAFPGHQHYGRGQGSDLPTEYGSTSHSQSRSPSSIAGRTMSVSEGSRGFQPAGHHELVRRSSVSANQHSTVKRKLPFASASDRREPYAYSASDSRPHHFQHQHHQPQPQPILRRHEQERRPPQDAYVPADYEQQVRRHYQHEQLPQQHQHSLQQLHQHQYYQTHQRQRSQPEQGQIRDDEAPSGPVTTQSPFRQQREHLGGPELGPVRAGLPVTLSEDVSLEARPKADEEDNSESPSERISIGNLLNG